VSHSLEGNIIRVPGKKGLFRAEEKGQESGRRERSRKLGLKKSIKMLTSRTGYPC